MKNYTIRGLDGRVVTVRASTEAEARHLVMVDRWGVPDGPTYGHLLQYAGRGLELVSVS